jgi:hypothetical protein
MVSLKPDAERIKVFVNQLMEQNWVRRTERRWWPKFEKVDDGLMVERPYNYTQPLPIPDSEYTVRFYLDGHLAYGNLYQAFDIPF